MEEEEVSRVCDGVVAVTPGLLESGCVASSGSVACAASAALGEGSGDDSEVVVGLASSAVLADEELSG
jgi:hypothetical protein